MGQDRDAVALQSRNQALTELTARIRVIRTEEGHDAFSLFKQGAISKAKLVELIAKEFI